MQKAEAIKHFGGVTKLARELGISRQAIHAWPSEVPDLYRYKLNYLSNGALPIDTIAGAAQPPPPQATQ